MRKMLSIVLAVCMVFMYTVPAFAYSSDDAMKVELSDQDMSKAMGAGAVDCEIASYSALHGGIQAVLTNRSASTATYDLDIIDVNGNVLQSLVSGGHLDNEWGPNPSIVVKASAGSTGGNFARIKVNSVGLPGMKCVHTAEAE